MASSGFTTRKLASRWRAFLSSIFATMSFNVRCASASWASCIFLWNIACLISSSLAMTLTSADGACDSIQKLLSCLAELPPFQRLCCLFDKAGTFQILQEHAQHFSGAAAEMRRLVTQVFCRAIVRPQPLHADRAVHIETAEHAGAAHIVPVLLLRRAFLARACFYKQ